MLVLHCREICQSFTKETFLFLENMRQEAPEFFYRHFYHDLKITNLNDLHFFSKSLEKVNVRNRSTFCAAC